MTRPAVDILAERLTVVIATAEANAARQRAEALIGGARFELMRLDVPEAPGRDSPAQAAARAAEAEARAACEAADARIAALDARLVVLDNELAAAAAADDDGQGARHVL